MGFGVYGLGLQVLVSVSESTELQVGLILLYFLLAIIHCTQVFSGIAVYSSAIGFGFLRWSEDACYVRSLGFRVQHRKTPGRVFSAHHNEDYVSKVLRRMISTRFFSCYVILKLLITIVLIIIVTILAIVVIVDVRLQ